ncbi:hypothetical protein [Microbacterium algeriense]|nr:hypothetical protein [Microbacterium algeriense]
MSTITPPRTDDDARPAEERPASPARERIFRRRGSGDFSKPPSAD